MHHVWNCVVYDPSGDFVFVIIFTFTFLQPHACMVFAHGFVSLYASFYVDMRLEGQAPDWLKPGCQLFKRILVDHTGKEIVHHFACT